MQLLLADLCARLPYGVKVNYKGLIRPLFSVSPTQYYQITLDNAIDGEHNGLELVSLDIDAVELKPYLRPLSSITEEEFQELHSICPHSTFNKTNVTEWIIGIGGSEYGRISRIDEISNFIDWLLANHFDYRGLIEKGLALEAPEGMYNKEESEKGSEIPIPKTVDEAVKTLVKIVSKEDRDYILENGAISVHNSMGRWIRNEWGLWTDSELKNELKKKGFEHPDDMSNYIIEEFIKYWNNKI